MGRETALAKATRYLIEGRIIIRTVTDHDVYALARGDGAIHRVTWRGNVWACTCPARSLNCSHLLAVRRVVATNLGNLTAAPQQ